MTDLYRVRLDMSALIIICMIKHVCFLATILGDSEHEYTEFCTNNLLNPFLHHIHLPAVYTSVPLPRLLQVYQRGPKEDCRQL